MQTYVVVYQLHGRIYGWFCQSASIFDAEQEFWNSLLVSEGRTIKCICELQSHIVDAIYAMYGREANGETTA